MFPYFETVDLALLLPAPSSTSTSTSTSSSTSSSTSQILKPVVVRYGQQRSDAVPIGLFADVEAFED
jgi:hypothetical protein